MVYYFCFLLLICFIAWGQKDNNQFDATKKLMSRFRSGDDGYYKGVEVSVRACGYACGDNDHNKGIEAIVRGCVRTRSVLVAPRHMTRHEVT